MLCSPYGIRSFCTFLVFPHLSSNRIQGTIIIWLFWEKCEKRDVKEERGIVKKYQGRKSIPPNRL
jgi:hypothetical protein